MGTSAIVSSLKEAKEAIGAGLGFPILVIPFGAERNDIPCRVLHSTSDMTEDLFTELLRSAFPLNGVPHLHLIQQKGSSYWQRFSAEETFLLI